MAVYTNAKALLARVACRWHGSVPLTRADIADFLGLTIETVSRQLTRLRKAGVISIENNRRVTVPNMDRLNEFAGN